MFWQGFCTGAAFLAVFSILFGLLVANRFFDQEPDEHEEGV